MICYSLGFVGSKGMFNFCWNSNGSASRRNRARHHGIRTDSTVVSNLDIAEDFRSRPNHYIITNPWGASIATEIPQCHVMVDRTHFANDGVGVEDDTAKMVNAQTFTDPHSHRNGNSRRDFDETLTEKP